MAVDASSVPVMVAVAELPTNGVVTVKVAVFTPAATVTDAGKEATGLLEAKVTTVPPVGAFLLRVTVPVTDVPPKIVFADRVREERVGGVFPVFENA